MKHLDHLAVKGFGLDVRLEVDTFHAHTPSSLKETEPVSTRRNV